MPTSEACLARAEEAERLAAMVSYGRDRERLIRQAQEWREKAASLCAEPVPPPFGPGPTPSPLARLRKALGGRTSEG